MSTSLSTGFLLADGQPDWDTIDFEIHCSRCEYNLRTLTTPRCPECGLDFQWQDVITSYRRRSQFLFEHHWRDRPFRSWFKTVWYGLRPRRFWQKVSIHDQIHAGPLWLMLLSSLLAFLVVLHGLAWCGAETIEVVMHPKPGIRSTGSTLGNEIAYAMKVLLNDVARAPLGPTIDYLQLPMYYLLTLLSILLALCSFRQTLGRCRIRTLQVLRVIAYAAVPIGIISALLPLIVICIGCLLFPFDDAELLIGIFIALAVLAFLTIPAHFLSSGLRYYLSLPRARLLGYVANVLAMLTVFSLSLFFSLLLSGGWK